MIGLLLIMVFLPIVSASEFEVWSSSLNACSCSIESQEVFVFNSGQDSLFTISISGKSAEWAAVSYNSIYLETGKKGSFLITYNVPCEAKEGNIEIKITSLDGTVKEFSQELNIGKCVNIQAVPILTLQNSCPCEAKEFIFKVKNIGNFKETYTFESSELNDYFTFIPGIVTLNPNEEISVVGVLNAPCGTYGNFEFELVAKSQNNEQKIELPAKILISDCYEYSVTAGKLKNIFETQTEPYKVCKDINYGIPILIENKEDFNNKYTIDIKSKYASLNKEEVLVRANSSEIVMINFNSEDAINTSVYLTTNSILGDKENKIRLPIIVEDCYNLDIVSSKNIFVEEGVAKVKLVNRGTKDINADVIIKGNKHSYLESNKILVEDKAILEIKTDDYKEGIDTVEVKFRLEDNEVVSKKFTLIFGKPIFYLYRYYIVLGIIILAILISLLITKLNLDERSLEKKKKSTEKLLANIEKHIPKEETVTKTTKKKSAKKEDKKTEETGKESEDIKFNWRLLWILLGLIVLIAVITLGTILFTKPSLLGINNSTMNDLFNFSFKFDFTDDWFNSNSTELVNITENITNASNNNNNS